MTDDLLKQAIAAIKAGNKVRGRELIAEILKTDRQNEQAWLWLTQTDITHEQRIKSLQNVLRINPDNKTAQEGLHKLQAARPAASKPTPVRTRTLLKQDKPASSSADSSRIIQDFIARRSRQGWLVVSQTSDSVQMRRPKQWSKTLLIIGFVGLLAFGAGLIFLILALFDYLVFQKEKTIFVTAAQIAAGRAPKDNQLIFQLAIGTALIFACGLCYAASSLTDSSTLTRSPAQLIAQAEPTSTPKPPQGPLAVTKDELIAHFETHYDFDWEINPYGNDGRFYKGEDSARNMKLNIWTNGPDEIKEMAFFFRIPLSGDDEVLKLGVEGTYDILGLSFPDWDGHDEWITQSLRDMPVDGGEFRTVINGVDVYFELGFEPELAIFVLTLVVE